MRSDLLESKQSLQHEDRCIDNNFVNPFYTIVLIELKMDLVNVVQTYILKILEEAGPGMKV